MYGRLTLIATPIGNLEDITFRALKELKNCDKLYCEDTRHTIKLLNHFEIKKPLDSYHDHNRASKEGKIIEELKKGLNLALVSDAGTPGISDPGADIVAACNREGIEVTICPGPVAGICALVLSGLDTRRFAFYGFIPVENKDRGVYLEKIKNEDKTVVIYESPHKLLSTLSALLKALGDRRVSIGRELTKLHEEVSTKLLSEHIEHYNQVPPKGEFVLVIEGAAEDETDWTDCTLKEHFEMYVNLGMDRMEAMKKVGKDRGISKRDVYKELNK